MSYARRTDTSHAEIRDALRALGWRVLDVHHFPAFVDLLAYKPSRGYVLVECKTGKGRKTKAQSKLDADGFPVAVLRTAADAARL